MEKKWTWIAIAGGIMAALVFGAFGIMAGQFPETIKMENPAYKRHTKRIVVFYHAKHVQDFKLACGECHHDENHKPLNHFKAGDTVQGCIECHTKPGLPPRGRNATKLTKTQRLEYHAEALHTSCRGCHKKVNKTNHTNKAPIACNKCHSSR